jgi:polar amino acid transport system permease protein
VAFGQGERPGPRVTTTSPQPPGPTDPTAGRRSRILEGVSGDARSVAIAVASTVVFLVLAALAILNSPGWEEVKQFFFNREEFAESFPKILDAFGTNVKLFCLAEVFILAVGLLLAVLRSLPGPVFFPLRALTIVYTDVFRGVPTILVIAMLGFGVPTLQIQGLPTSEFFWALVALVLVYSAYVAEVYRAGIQSVHPSQEAAARSLGLTRRQTLRFVVVPQAVRRVIPPLLNDFIGLQKDTALVAILGTVEAFRQAQIDTAASFNYTAYTATAVIFIVVTIPLARFTDWLVERDRRRQLAGRMA